MRIICVGQSAYDITLPLDHYPVENKKIRVQSRVECGGGSASNCAYLLAKWGMETYFAGVVGDDYYGKKIIGEFEEIGVNTKYLHVDDHLPTTSSYIIANTTAGTRTILTDRHPEIKMLKQVIKKSYRSFDDDITDEFLKEFVDYIKIKESHIEWYLNLFNDKIDLTKEKTLLTRLALNKDDVGRYFSLHYKGSYNRVKELIYVNIYI